MSARRHIGQKYVSPMKAAHCLVDGAGQGEGQKEIDNELADRYLAVTSFAIAIGPNLAM
ncbi:MAG: hypothetical protein ACREYA_16795 [Cupriavidus necator]